MAERFSEILKKLRDFDETAQARSVEMRMAVSSLIATEMSSRKWDQKEMAAFLDMKPSRLNLIFHGNCNLTLDVIADIVHRLGRRAELQFTTASGRQQPMPAVNRSNAHNTRTIWEQKVCPILISRSSPSSEISIHGSAKTFRLYGQTASS